MTRQTIKKSLENTFIWFLLEITTPFHMEMAFARVKTLLLHSHNPFISNCNYRCEEKSCQHWSLFTKLLSSVTDIFLICLIKSRAIVWIYCTENKRKIEKCSSNYPIQSKKKSEVNEVNEREYSKTPSRLSSTLMSMFLRCVHASL